MPDDQLDSPEDARDTEEEQLPEKPGGLSWSLLDEWERERLQRPFRGTRPKNVALATALNLWPLPVGLGYVYLGDWRAFLSVFLGWQIIGSALVRITIGYSGICMGAYELGVLTYAAVGGYRKAKEYNRKVAALRDRPDGVDEIVMEVQGK